MPEGSERQWGAGAIEGEGNLTGNTRFRTSLRPYSTLPGNRQHYTIVMRCLGPEVYTSPLTRKGTSKASREFHLRVTWLAL